MKFAHRLAVRADELENDALGGGVLIARELDRPRPEPAVLDDRAEGIILDRIFVRRPSSSSVASGTCASVVSAVMSDVKVTLNGGVSLLAWRC